MDKQNYNFTLEQSGPIKFSQRFEGNLPKYTWPKTVILTREVSSKANISLPGKIKHCEFFGSNLSWSHPFYIESLESGSPEWINAENAVEEVANQLKDDLRMAFSPHTSSKFLSTDSLYKSTRHESPPLKSYSKREWRAKSQKWVSQFLQDEGKNLENDKLAVGNTEVNRLSRLFQHLSDNSWPGSIDLSLQKVHGEKITNLRLDFSENFIQPQFSIVRKGTSVRTKRESNDSLTQTNSTMASYMAAIAMVYQLTLQELSEIIKIEALLTKIGDYSPEIAKHKISLTVEKEGWIDGLMQLRKVPANKLFDSKIKGIRFNLSK